MSAARAGRRHQFRRTRADDGRPAHRQSVSQDRRADRRAGAGGARHRAPADDQERQPRRCAPARSSASPAWSAPGAASSPRRSSASRPPSRARSGSWARPSGSIRPKARAPRGSPTSRKTAAVQGLVRPMSVLHNLSLAALGALSRAGFIDRARRAATGGRGGSALQRQDELGRRDRGTPLRRQPAEDRARQVARQQSEAAHPRRADARHRRRRQGRDPPPDERARRNGRRDPDDLERAARRCSA